MKYTILIVFSLLFFQSQAQYNVKSEHIINPDLNIEYVKSNADFWIRNAYDPEYGGFFSNVNQQGNVTTMIPQRTGFDKTPYKRKSLIAQSRHGYGFTRAFMLTGDEEYLTYAKSALDFLFNYGWDTENEGWFCYAKSDGTLDITQYDLRDLEQKWSFQQHYALLGAVAHYEATRHPHTEEFMNKGVNTIYTKMWDSRENYKGYYETANVDWSNKRNKGFTSTIDAITTNAELSYLVTQEDKYKTRLLELADIIVERFIPQMDNPSVKVLYPETYSTNWAVNLNASQKGYVGHFIKTAWCLGRAYLCDTTKTEYKDAAVKILNEAWTYENGDVSVWDHTYGGPFNEIDILTGEWGSSNGNLKDYWTVEQGFTGPMINYYITKDDVYLQMADEALYFFMNHFIDTEYGEIFYYLDASGSVVKRGIKGDDYKASYHSIELGYYAYLYSNLYYLNKQASLYYKFEPKNEARQITLTPVPMEDNYLRIKSVDLDGDEFTAFNAETRTITVAPNQEGKFKVTFERCTDVHSDIKTVNQIAQIRLYPNPAVSYIQIDSSSMLSEALVFDVFGKQVLQQKATDASLRIDIRNLSKGVYFVNLFDENGRTATQKFIKQ
ncbi:MAG: AGE family epimerase/isomerase [Candidatus Symbiothrix sp.]|nr:AGE family epimerase/isomerase [Candidatus Symbiothrix sp.]